MRHDARRVKNKVRKDDMIRFNGSTITIGKVIFWDYYDGIYDVEFVDTTGKYHHWISDTDGGYHIPHTKRLYDCDGNDVTDLFIKYNQPA